MLQLVNILHNTLMQQRLADVSGGPRHTRDGRRANEEHSFEHGLVSSPAPDFVQIQRVGSHVYHARRYEQHQLDKSVVQHVEHGSPRRQRILRSQKPLHRHAHQNKSNLRHGRTGQRPLQIDGEQCQHRPKHHGDSPQDQNHLIPVLAGKEQVPGRHENTENSALGQNSAEQGRRRSRRHRMGLGQPDMQRVHTRLGPESHQAEHSRSKKFAVLLRSERCHQPWQPLDNQ
ncbi:hypothetical protein SDC9_158203 [bioreactor metagenome]|uniref:Uncharacterized protein n=1 Tax=bioreactor metagenome TaxID=1076179 RepID=A0A645FBB8_9ZZZZ